MPSHRVDPEIANLASSSKRKNGARHAYLSQNGVVIVSAATYRGALSAFDKLRATLRNIDGDTIREDGGK